MRRRMMLALILFFLTGVVTAQDATPEATAEATPNTAPLPAGIPDPVGFQWSLVADGFDSPIGIVSANDGTGRLFAWEQSGKIWVIKDGEVSLDPFLDISELLPPDVFKGGYTEQGLLGEDEVGHDVNGTEPGGWMMT